MYPLDALEESLLAITESRCHHDRGSPAQFTPTGCYLRRCEKGIESAKTEST